jgi:hypothetical protein
MARCPRCERMRDPKETTEVEPYKGTRLPRVTSEWLRTCMTLLCRISIDLPASMPSGRHVAPLRSRTAQPDVIQDQTPGSSASDRLRHRACPVRGTGPAARRRPGRSRPARSGCGVVAARHRRAGPARHARRRGRADRDDTLRRPFGRTRRRSKADPLTGSSRPSPHRPNDCASACS